MLWIDRLKLKALAYLAAIGLAVVVVSAAGVMLWPVIGVAVAAAVVSVSKVAQRLDQPTCLSCGTDLADQPIGTHGVACPTCGSIHQPRLTEIERLATELKAKARESSRKA